MPRPLPAAVMAVTDGDPDAVRRYRLDAAHRVIATEGLAAAASSRAIAEEAGVAGGTLHNYFGSHTQLLARAVVHHAASLMGPVAGLPSRAGRYTVADNLRYFARQAAGVLDQIVPALAATFSDTELLTAVRQELAVGDRMNDPALLVERYCWPNANSAGYRSRTAAPPPPWWPVSATTTRSSATSVAAAPGRGHVTGKSS